MKHWQTLLLLLIGSGMVAYLIYLVIIFNQSPIYCERMTSVGTGKQVGFKCLEWGIK